jgi:hypothetical protein
MLDIPFRGEIKATHKIIFSSNKGNLPERIFFKIKEFFRGAEMRAAAKDRVISLCNSYDAGKRPKKIEELLTKINNSQSEGVEEDDVINAFTDVFKEQIFKEKITGTPVTDPALKNQELAQAVGQKINAEFNDGNTELTIEQIQWAIKNLAENENVRAHSDTSLFGGFQNIVKDYCENPNNIQSLTSVDRMLNFLYGARKFLEQKTSTPYAEKLSKGITNSIENLQKTHNELLNIEKIKLDTLKNLTLKKTTIEEKLITANPEKLNPNIQPNSNLQSKAVNIHPSKKEGAKLTKRERTTNLPRFVTPSKIVIEKKSTTHLPVQISQFNKTSVINALAISPVFLGQASSKEDRSALAAFRNFIRNPEQYSDPTKNIDNLYNFIDYFFKNINLLDADKKSDCLEGVDRLLGFLQSREKTNLIQINENDEQHQEFTEIILALRQHSDPIHPSGFLKELVSYLIENELNGLSYHALSHLTRNPALMTSISNQLSTSQKIKFEKKMNALETDLKKFKKINQEAKWQTINERRFATGLITKQKFNELTDPYSTVNLEEAAKIKKVTSIKSALNEISAFRLNEKNKRALQAFFQFLDNPKANWSKKDYIENLQNFSTLFFSNIQLLNPNTRLLCMDEIDKLRGALLVNGKLGMKEIRPNALAKTEALNLIKSWQFEADYEAIPSGFLIDMANYLNNGKSSINSTSYWALEHLMTHQAKSIKEPLNEQNARNFSNYIEALKQDLKEFKKTNAE